MEGIVVIVFALVAFVIGILMVQRSATSAIDKLKEEVVNLEKAIKRIDEFLNSMCAPPPPIVEPPKEE